MHKDERADDISASVLAGAFGIGLCLSLGFLPSKPFYKIKVSMEK